MRSLAAPCRAAPVIRRAPQHFFNGGGHMQTAPVHQVHHLPNTPVPTEIHYGVSTLKNPSQTTSPLSSPVSSPVTSRAAGCQMMATRRFFAAALWRAFPSPSEHDLALKAAAVLNVSPRQVQNWLRCEHSASSHHFAAIARCAGGIGCGVCRRSTSSAAGSTCAGG